MIDKNKIPEILDLLEAAYPEAECALHHQNVFQLITAVALSAQTTDKSVNQVTPALFARYPTPQALAEADPEDVAEFIKRIGMYKTKSKNIVAMAQKLCGDFGGEVPDDYEALVSLPGVGRKTANVVLSVGFGQPRSTRMCSAWPTASGWCMKKTCSEPNFLSWSGFQKIAGLARTTA